MRSEAVAAAGIGTAEGTGAMLVGARGGGKAEKVAAD
jgi:hypothetical protein